MNTETTEGTLPLPGFVVARVELSPRRAWLGVGAKAEVPRASRAFRAWGANAVGEEVTEHIGRRIDAAEGTALWLVNEGPFPLLLSLEAVARDGRGQAWDMILDLRLWVRDAKRLLVPEVLCLVDSVRPLTPEGLAAWLRERLPAPMHQRLADEPEQRWRDLHVRSVEAWQAELNTVLADWGLEAALVSRPGWSCPTAEVAAKRREADEARERSEAAKARERECLELQRAHEARLEDIAAERERARRRANREATAEEEKAAAEQKRASEAATHLLEAERRKSRFAAELAEAEQRVALARYETLLRRELLTQAELQVDIEATVTRRLEHVRAEDRLRDAQEAERRLREREAEVTTAVERLMATATALGAQGQTIEEAVRRLESCLREPGRWDRIEARLDAVLGLLDRTNAAPKRPSSRESFGTLLSGVPEVAFHRCDREVRTRVTTRDAGGRRFDGTVVSGGAEAEEGLATVWLGDAVDLELTSPVRGSLTVVNVGTSGRRWLIVPHAISNPGTCIEAGRPQKIPGSEVFPWGALHALGFRDLGAAGPEGVETFIALVTAKPLIRHDDPRLEPAAPGTLFCRIPESLWVDLVEAFRAEPVNSKAAGLLQYRIEKRPVTRGSRVLSEELLEVA